MTRWVLVSTALLLGCGDEIVELPRDAARPLAAPPIAAAEHATAPKADATPIPDTPVVGPVPAADVSATSQRDLDRVVTPMLHGRALAHGVYQARFGPSSSTGQPTAIVLTRSATPSGPSTLGGFAVSGRTRFELPILHDGDALHSVAAIMFRDVDDDPDREVIVVVSYRDEDPAAPPFFSNVVLDWDVPQARFVRRERLEGELEAMRTAGEVAAHLRRLNPP